MLRLKGILLLPLFLLGGCATTSVFTPYPEQTKAWKAEVGTQNYTPALADLDKKRDSADALLYLMERGRIAMLAGQTEESRKDFDAVIARFRTIEDRALISLSATAAQGATLLTNDNAAPYEGETFERVFVHQMQALNYLALGQRDEALVEVRRANFIQDQALKNNEKKVSNAEQEASHSGLRTSDYDRYFTGMSAAAGRVKSAFQNAYTFYTSALIYEAAGQLNDAYIDDKKALEIWPDNPYIRQDVLRLGTRLGMDEVRSAADHEKPTLPGNNEGSVVILFEEGFAPVKQALMLPIITENTLNHVGFPVYAGPFSSPQPQSLSLDGHLLYTSPIVDVQALATRALKDHIPAMIARQYLRLLSKQRLQRELDKNAGPLGSLAGMIYSLVSEQPDLRSWNSLPNSAQIARTWLPAGSHTLSVAGQETTVTVLAGHITIVHILAEGMHSSLRQFSL